MFYQGKGFFFRSLIFFSFFETVEVVSRCYLLYLCLSGFVTKFPGWELHHLEEKVFCFDLGKLKVGGEKRKW